MSCVRMNSVRAGCVFQIQGYFWHVLLFHSKMNVKMVVLLTYMWKVLSSNLSKDFMCIERHFCFMCFGQILGELL